MMTRFLPFLLFPADKPTPKYVQYLGKVLPAAVFGLLVIYCLKDVSIFTGSHGIPELIAIGVGSAVTSLEKADAVVHRRRHHLLYVVSAVGFLRKTECK